MAQYLVGGAVVLGGAFWATGPKALKPPVAFSVELPDTEDKGKGLGAIRRHPDFQDNLVNAPVDHPDCLTCYDTFQNGVKAAGDGPCLGYRKVVGKDEKGKPKVAADWTWITYNEAREKALAFGAGLIKLDLVPEIEGDPKSTGQLPLRALAIMMKNRPEWIIAEQGCYSQSTSTVPLYDTLGPETVEMVLNEVQLKAVLIAACEIPKFIEVKSETPSLKAIIVCDEISEDAKKSATAAGLDVYTFDEVIKAGQSAQVTPNPPSPDNVATFLYTSGTTGKSKGAVLSHRNLVTDAAGAFAAKIFNIGPGDYHLSYLPLAHGFERVVECACYYHGVAVGFYQGETLKIPEDLKSLRPTLFPSVPRLLNKFYDKIMAGAKEAGGLKTAMFNMAYAQKQAGLKQGYTTHRIWDPIVFNKIGAKVGLDRVRAIITGSAPIASHVLEFLRITFKCSVMEGYGQTETTAAATCQIPSDLSFGNVGGPLPTVEVRLVSIPEMDYLITDREHAPQGAKGLACVGRGEICFRGPICIEGYFNRPEQNAELKDEDGWVHTGDIGLWLPNGALKIIDRKKNIFKLAQGEYIAPEKIENVYGNSPYVAQSFVYGDSFQSQLVAIVVPDDAELQKLAASKGIQGDTATLCKNADIIKAVHADMDRVRKDFKLHGFEHAAKVYLEPELFSLENGLLTPTFKLMRNPAKAKYQANIDEMYHALGGTTAGIRQGAH